MCIQGKGRGRNVLKDERQLSFKVNIYLKCLKDFDSSVAPSYTNKWAGSTEKSLTKVKPQQKHLVEALSFLTSIEKSLFLIA